MRTIFCSLVLLFTAISVYAQNTVVDYVSFFPPAHVIHNQVLLRQDSDSFSFEDAAGETSATGGYTAKRGGLILAAANESTTNIDKLVIDNNGVTVTFAVPNFNVDNIISVSALGRIQNISVGEKPAVCGGDCQAVFISSNGINFPIHTVYDSVNFTLRSSGLTTTFRPFSAASGGGFFPLNGVSNLKWVNLRIKGTEECRRYLVANKQDAVDNCPAKP